jgi:hypothetical protein
VLFAFTYVNIRAKVIAVRSAAQTSAAAETA